MIGSKCGGILSWCLSAKLGQERFSGAVARVRRQIWEEIFEWFGRVIRERQLVSLGTRRLASISQLGVLGRLLLQKCLEEGG